MIIILIRTIIVYVFVLIGMRIMGKRQVSEMQPFELVVTLMIAELATLPMENLEVPLINGLIAISALLFLEVLISYINLKSEKTRKIICGKPSILISKGKINEKELKKLRININDLVEQIRIKNYPSLNDVEYAILETNGDLSIIPKANKKIPTLDDLNIVCSHEGIPITLVVDGHINFESLRIIEKDKIWLEKQLKNFGVNNVKNVLFAYIDGREKIYVQEKNMHSEGSK
ncbi:DUF421 domain-containing protein [Clostridium sp. D2Q-14]|uniref:DUF421 domain-containing protein n=1 Tax=Anaeromonas gelatinilytica TaxID=2683194 RepID=UPI00193C01E2|nr:DUF421 domain-containing protein [Anaeromonas gelatinilytica]MBS4535056.1 DUF421 domain-containing protein [Anaeromonas gelatinilytica]